MVQVGHDDDNVPALVLRLHLTVRLSALAEVGECPAGHASGGAGADRARCGLAAHGHKGPAEIPGKREFTYRHVLWQARGEGVELRFPPAHPFNPLSALRLCLAAGRTAQAVDAIFDWIWRQGRAAGDSLAALAPVTARLGMEADAVMPRPPRPRCAATPTPTVAAGVYGVPTLAVGNDLFWGNDAHAFALAALRSPSVLGAEMQRVSMLPVGVQRI